MLISAINKVSTAYVVGTKIDHKERVRIMLDIPHGGVVDIIIQTMHSLKLPFA